MQKFINKKTTIRFFLALILFFAFVVRFWNFSSWLYFEADQARDASIVRTALEKGPGYLPLLGPRAAGTFLRLGPAEYYFQYLSALIFHSAEPFVLAYPALLFSILSILIFYLFLKNFFPASLSLLATAVYAFSFVLIQYARFSWNPNGIPFWGILFIFSLYQATVLENRKKAGWWLILAGLSYGVVSQLHFLALVGFPLVAAIFWIFYFPRKIKLVFWVGAVAVVLMCYLPMFFSEISTDGDNLNQFRYALTAKAGGDEQTLQEKIKSDSRQVAIAFSMFLTSFGHKESRVSFYFGTFLLLAGFARLVFLAKKDKNKRLLGWLIFSWTVVFMFLYFKTSTSLKPRFFFPIAAIPFFLWAYLMDFFMAFNQRKKVAFFLVFCLSTVLVWANLDAVSQWYSFLKKADDKEINRKMFLKQESGITLGSLRAVMDYMAIKARDNQKNVCYDGIQEYKRAMEFLLESYYPKIGRARISNGMSLEERKNCQFFSFAQKKTKRAKISSRHEQYFESKLAFESGNLSVWDLTANADFYAGKELPMVDSEETVAENSSEEILEETDSDLVDPVLSEENNKDVPEETVIENNTSASTPDFGLKPPRRKERVFWKDLFQE